MTEHDHDTPPEVLRGVRMGVDCAAHHHREWVPLEVHHVWPLGDGGPNVAANRVTICENAHGSIHSLLDHMRKGPVPWILKRRYGRKVRALAQLGYDRIQRGYL